jgi:hypothetical protein
MANSEIDESGTLRGPEGEDTGEHGNKPYDLHELHLMANNDSHFIRHALSIFIENSEESVSKLKEALKNENWKLVRETVHKLLPSYIHLKVNSVVPLLHQVKNSEYAGNDLSRETALASEIISEIEKVLLLMRRQIEE